VNNVYIITVIMIVIVDIIIIVSQQFQCAARVFQHGHKTDSKHKTAKLTSSAK